MSTYQENLNKAIRDSAEEVLSDFSFTGFEVSEMDGWDADITASGLSVLRTKVYGDFTENEDLFRAPVTLTVKFEKGNLISAYAQDDRGSEIGYLEEDFRDYDVDKMSVLEKTLHDQFGENVVLLNQMENGVYAIDVQPYNREITLDYAAKAISFLVQEVKPNIDDLSLVVRCDSYALDALTESNLCLLMKIQ